MTSVTKSTKCTNI